jgi:hypothetical protein
LRPALRTRIRRLRSTNYLPQRLIRPLYTRFYRGAVVLLIIKGLRIKYGRLLMQTSYRVLIPLFRPSQMTRKLLISTYKAQEGLERRFSIRLFVITTVHEARLYYAWHLRVLQLCFSLMGVYYTLNFGF